MTGIAVGVSARPDEYEFRLDADRGVLEFPTLSPAPGAGVAGSRRSEVSRMESAVDLYGGLKEARGGAFRGAEDGADE